MDLKLKILQGTSAGQEISVAGQRFLFGRAEDCHLRSGSEMISRHHCAIVVDQSYVAIRDFGSKNGTYVNNERVVGECELKSGDQLRVGPLEFEISLRQGELGGKKKPPVHNAKQAAERTAAGQPDEIDVAQWLDDPAGAAPSVVDSQSMVVLETQPLKLTETEQIASIQMQAFIAAQAEPAVAELTPGRNPAHQAHSAAAQPAAAQPHSPTTTAVTPAAVTPANVAKRTPPSTFQMPDSEPEAPSPVAGDKSGRLDKKKVFGKLPAQNKGPEDTRSAASELLGKMRKRR
ncbi:MAG TPA: FHA domain-containing protein [Pirellulales bacterium]|jgi:pSer/pThr/pTyr-binding forkhead associated (FHA) protein|nr:FHA domain-containing protein [Pirellulales bacterium]